VLADRLRQIRELGLGEIATWIARVGRQELDRDIAVGGNLHFLRLRRTVDLADQCGKPSPESSS